MKNNIAPEEIWAAYERAQDYNRNIGLYETVKQNENFFIGKQWEGVIAPDLEKPVLNFLKRVVTYFISMIVSDDVAASLTPYHDGGGQNAAIAKLLGQEIDRVIERTNAKARHREALRDCAVDGDTAFFLRFDPKVETGQEAKGEICVELVDNTKLLFGNPHSHLVQEQPYLLLVKRLRLDSARRLAQERGLDPSAIQPDEQTQFYGEDKEPDKNLVTILTRLWRQNGTVWFTESTKETLLRGPVDTGYKLYPVAYMNWERVKNSYHGQAAISGLIPNQIFVNKLWAMAMEQQKSMAFPKIFYNQSLFPNGFSNRVGQAVAVNGDPNQAALMNFRGADMSAQVLELVERTINYTRDFMGASDAALGNVKPDNTSAIIAVQKASSAPLELQRMAFYQFVEDYARIILDMIRVDYGVRQVELTGEDGSQQGAYVDFGAINYEGMQLKVDVGASSYWSELMQMQTWDNLFAKGILTDAVTYLEGVPDAYIKNKNKIIAKIKEQQAQMQQMQMMAMGGGGSNAVPQMQAGGGDSVGP